MFEIVHAHMHVNIQIDMRIKGEIYKQINYKKGEKKSKRYITSPIPIPYIKRPITMTTKTGANAVIRAPTRYDIADTINSLLLPMI